MRASVAPVFFYVRNSHGPPRLGFRFFLYYYGYADAGTPRSSDRSADFPTHAACRSSSFLTHVQNGCDRAPNTKKKKKYPHTHTRRQYNKINTVHTYLPINKYIRVYILIDQRYSIGITAHNNASTLQPRHRFPT